MKQKIYLLLITALTFFCGTRSYADVIYTTAPVAGGNTVKVDGAANPVTFSYTTSPTIQRPAMQRLSRCKL